MATVRVEAAESGDALAIHLPGVQAAKSRLVDECFNTLLACADSNGCFERGFSLACLGTVAIHDRATGCTSQSFGLTRAKGGAVVGGGRYSVTVGPVGEGVAADGGGLALRLQGVRAAKPDLVQDCFQTLMGCAAQNACFERGLSAACVGTIAIHDRSVGCVSESFGLAGA